MVTACAIDDDIALDAASDTARGDSTSAEAAPTIGFDDGDDGYEADDDYGADEVGDDFDDADDVDEADDDAAESDQSDPSDETWNDGSLARAGYDPSLTADTPCLENEGDPLPGITFTVAHQVVDGQLGATCFGSEDDTLLSAWYILSDITPPGQLRDLTVFAGFEGAGNESSTLAYVVPVDDDGSQFQMAVNLPMSRDDWDETALTMAHEFSHVFTAVPNELDRFAAQGDCGTYESVDGCYIEGSVLADWYQRFWPRFGYDPSGGQEADEIDGEARCDANPGFFGSYGASNPEEDFAESFAAYVMRVDALSSAQQEKLDWIDGFAGLREFRERAEATGYGPFANNFGACG